MNHKQRIDSRNEKRISSRGGNGRSRQQRIIGDGKEQTREEQIRNNNGDPDESEKNEFGSKSDGDSKRDRNSYLAGAGAAQEAAIGGAGDGKSRQSGVAAQRREKQEADSEASSETMES
ncbi:hypothetical protein CRG98_006853 [Punica granatum]|uniref:Uncharacterized protein n=1 Tax=Punica granatum TaxID=22663 RepID=A0A2I0KWE2_PUNGR|nr:hypothetical protein CRG98_006853 [Punica granatum]